MRVCLVEPFRLRNRFQVLCTLLDELGHFVDFHEYFGIAASVDELFQIIVDALYVFNIIVVDAECFKLAIKLLLFCLVLFRKVFLQLVSSVFQSFDDFSKPDVDVLQLSLLQGEYLRLLVIDVVHIVSVDLPCV